MLPNEFDSQFLTQLQIVSEMGQNLTFQWSRGAVSIRPRSIIAGKVTIPERSSQAELFHLALGHNSSNQVHLHCAQLAFLDQC